MAMDPVSNVMIGNYTIGNPQGGATNRNEADASNAQTQNQQTQLAQSTNGEAFAVESKSSDAFGRMLLNFNKTQTINPSDYLSQDRINDIEAAMAEFESGVDEIANTIEAEFPEMFATDQKNALAAEIYAAE